MKWPKACLGEVAQVVSGATPKSSVDEYWDGDIPWITPADLSKLEAKEVSTTSRQITEAGLASCSARILPARSVLFSSRAPIGHVAINAVPMATNQGFKSLVPDQKLVNPDFLYWWLKSNKSYLQSLGRGATFKEVSKEIVESIEIPLPPLEEQRRIAAILDKASKAKELSDTAEQLAKELRVSIFEEMLGSKVWPTAFVGDVVSRLTNGYVGPTRDIYVEEGIPYLLARHVKGGRLLYDEKTRISPDFNNRNKKSILAEGDVLLVQSGHIGSSCVVPGEHVGHNCHAMIVITTDHLILTGDYLSALFETPRMQRAFKRIQTGITVPHLNCRDVRNMEIPIPPLEYQHELSRRLSTLSKNASMLEDRKKQLESLTKSLGSNFFHDALQ